MKLTTNKVHPKPNSPARSLVQNANDRGWDPTKIWNQKTGKYDGSIAEWDRPREEFDRNIQNQEQAPGDHPDILTGKADKDPTGGPVMTEKTTWEHPDTSREARVSGKPKMTLSDPDPGGGY